MHRTANLRRLFTVLLLAVALLIGTAFSQVAPTAFAAETYATNEISNVKGDSSAVHQSYHKLQTAAHDFRQAFRSGAAGETPGQQVPLSDPTNRTKQAAKNITQNTRNAFGRAADSVKDALDPG